MAKKRSKPLLKEAVSEYDYLTSRLEIDKHDLDREWVEQPRLYHRAAEGAASAARVYEEMKQAKKTVAAGRSVRLRAELQAAAQKVTEKTVEAAVEQDREHLDACDELTQAGEEKDRWVSLRDSFTHRRDTLNNVCKLYLGNYYESENSFRGTQRQVDEVENQRRRQRIHDSKKP
jgi:hypothetical protein